MAAILEMPQYVAYQKNVVYACIKLSAKSHSFNILRTMDGLSCPTTRERHKIRIASQENVDNQTPRNTNFTHQHVSVYF